MPPPKRISEYQDHYATPDQRHKCTTCTTFNDLKFKPSDDVKSNKNLIEVDSKINGDQQASYSYADPVKPKTVVAGPDKSRYDMKSIIQYDRREETKNSDYSLNYLKPNKEDYRKKRTQTYYPTYDEPSISKTAASSYKDDFIIRK